MTERYLDVKQSTQQFPCEDTVLAEVIRRLAEAYQPERIYLFGSKARGEGGPDSDYDLMVIVPDDAPPERRRSRLAYEVLRGTGTAVDVLVWLKSNFERRLHAYWHLDLKIWDIAAASLILQRAGGILTDAQGVTWLYSDGGYIATNGVIHGWLLNCIQAGLEAGKKGTHT